MNQAHRILIVDDDTSGRRLTRATLTKAGFKVIEAADGQKALDILRCEMPDLVLMDVSMPVMDGFTACAELRKLPDGTRVPVVMMTGLEDVQSIDRAFEAGATDFITKPINWTILAHRVRYMLRASHAIDELKQNQRRLSNAQRIGVMGDWEWDVREDAIVPSEQARRIFGHEEAPAGPMALDVFMAHTHREDLKRLRRAIDAAVEQGDDFSIDHRIVQSNGALRHVHQQIEVIQRDAGGRATRLAGAVHDVTRQKDAEEQILRLAYYDPLTGLPNRRLFTEQLKNALSRAERLKQPLALMFLDLDNFKRVNDTLGHGAGDELLCAVSARLSGMLRGYDTVARHSAEPPDRSIARLGGDEFIILLTDLASSKDAVAIGRRLVEGLAEPVLIQNQEIFVGGSVGVAVYPEHGLDADTLLMNADTAMYRAKEGGRGRLEFYDPVMNNQALERLTLESMLRRAIEREEFVLHYQPRIHVQTGDIVGAEALIRWKHPDRGMVPPADFIPLAEECGLIIKVGEWAIEAACRQSATWHAAGMPLIPIAVNLAAPHLRERGLPDLVACAMQRHGIPACGLEIEVTESILMVEPELSIEIASKLEAIGVRLSIDDFGTGYSSLSYLKRLPINALKIDRSFVHDLARDPDDAAIITAIVAMAHGLKLKVVAEGVETEAQLAFLESLGCDEFQGFLESPALEPTAFASFFEARRSNRLLLVA